MAKIDSMIRVFVLFSQLMEKPPLWLNIRRLMEQHIVTFLLELQISMRSSMKKYKKNY